MFDAFAKGIAIGILLIFSVGPVIFTVIKQSINNGKIGGFSFVSGVWISDILWIILSNAFSEWVIQLQSFEKPIGFTGSLFLIALGIFYVFFKKVDIKKNESEIKISSGTHARLCVSGFLINTLNPAVMIFWITTATAIATANTLKERIIIFSTCMAINIAADVLKIILASKLRTKLNEKNISLINKISGILLIGFGAALMIGVIYTTTKH
jgi:threonine/homoserine/homoserine lactone efflux protein